MAERVLRRPIVLIAALLVASAALVAVTVSESRASHVLDPADTIVFEFGASGNKIKYGSTEQQLVPGSSNCTLATASTEGPIMAIAATSVDKKGDPVDPSPVGLVDFGMGTSQKGVGNGQDCALIDQGEAVMLTLTEHVGGRLIHSFDVDIEGKFGGAAKITYLLGGVGIGSEVLVFNELSDNGPDARYLDNNYYEGLPLDEGLQGIVFDGVMIEPDSDPASDPGSVSLQSGVDFPDPGNKRTTFHLIPAVDCGDSIETGGPYQDDNPLANFFVGPTKGGEPCAVPISLTTERQGEGDEEQIVNLAPPEGFSWEGVGISGILTVEWDVELPDDEDVDRTSVRRIPGDPLSDEVIPWCEAIVPYTESGDGWSYILDWDPEDEDADEDGRFPEATDAGLCLIDQSTELVLYDHDDNAETPDEVWTQTTEIFYIYEDPMLVRN